MWSPSASVLVAAWWQRLSAHDPWETTLRLTAVYALVRFGLNRGAAGFLVGVLAVVALVFPRACRSWVLWGGIALSLAAYEWSAATAYSEDLLGMSWFLALTIAAWADPEHGQTRRLSARSLIGIVFAQAFAWKALLTQDFIDGSFMRFSLMFCSVFDDVTLRTGLMSRAEYDAVSALYTGIQQADGSLTTAVAVPEPFSVTVAAGVITVWTLLTEGAAGVAFLAPSRFVIYRIRNVVLLTFLGTVYFFLPVQGFGLVFASMGYAQTEDDEVRARSLYLCMFFAILLWFYLLNGSDVIQILRRLAPGS